MLKIPPFAKLQTVGLQTFFNGAHLLVQLGPIERCFLEFCAEKADDQNRIIIDHLLKRDFLNFLDHAKIKTKGTSARTINGIPGKLSDLGLIFPEHGKFQYYRINPKYLWKGSQKARLNLLRQLVQSRVKIGLPIDALVDQKVENFDILKKGTEGL